MIFQFRPIFGGREFDVVLIPDEILDFIQMQSVKYGMKPVELTREKTSSLSLLLERPI